MKKSKLQFIKSTAVPLPEENIDTDQIIPARFLKATTREGFGDNLFRDWRYDRDTGEPNPEFVLNNPRYSGEILIAGHNFGCGSSREHAAWALVDYGFKVVISSFFADIFKNNALNNLLLPLQVPQDLLKQLIEAVQSNPQLEIEVDVDKQLLAVPELGIEYQFELNPYKKMCLLNGYDDVDYLLSLDDKITAWEESHPARARAALE